MSGLTGEGSQGMDQTKEAESLRHGSCEADPHQLSKDIIETCFPRDTISELMNVHLILPVIPTRIGSNCHVQLAPRSSDHSLKTTLLLHVALFARLAMRNSTSRISIQWRFHPGGLRTVGLAAVFPLYSKTAQSKFYPVEILFSWISS